MCLFIRIADYKLLFATKKGKNGESRKICLVLNELDAVETGDRMKKGRVCHHFLINVALSLGSNVLNFWSLILLT